MENEEIPKYDVTFDVCGDIVDICYDGVHYNTSDIVDLNEFGDRYFKERYPWKEYPWKPRDPDTYYIAWNPGGSGDYAIHRTRKLLEEELASLRDSVSPEHPCTQNRLEGEDLEDYCPSIWADDYEEYGWEDLSDAKIVLVKAPFCKVPIYAIEFPPKVKLRKRNPRLDQLHHMVDGMTQVIWDLDCVLDCEFDLSEYISELDTLKDVAKFLSEVTDDLERQLESESLIGRQE